MSTDAARLPPKFTVGEEVLAQGLVFAKFEKSRIYSIVEHSARDGWIYLIIIPSFNGLWKLAEKHIKPLETKGDKLSSNTYDKALIAELRATHGCTSGYGDACLGRQAAARIWQLNAELTNARAIIHGDDTRVRYAITGPMRKDVKKITFYREQADGHFYAKVKLYAGEPAQLVEAIKLAIADGAFAK